MHVLQIEISFLGEKNARITWAIILVNYMHVKMYPVFCLLEKVSWKKNLFSCILKFFSVSKEALIISEGYFSYVGTNCMFILCSQLITQCFDYPFWLSLFCY